MLSYTRRWFCTVDRGGLFPISDAALLLFVGIEKIVQSTLPEYMSKRSAKDKETFQEEVIKKIMSDEDVQFHWCLMSQTIECDKDQQVLLKDIIMLYVVIRGFSIAAAWQEEYKELCKKNTYKSTGLRKSLSGSKN